MCCLRKCQSPFALLCLAGALVFLAAGCFVASELVLPAMVTANVHALRIVDSQSKFDTLFKDRPLKVEIENVYFNLTNAYDLQTKSPPPKPTFQEVRVRFEVMTHIFDYNPSTDGDTFKYKVWAKQTFVNDAEKSLPIVQANPSLTTLLMFLGGEAGLRGIYQLAAATDVATACGLFPPALLPYCYLAPTAYQTLLDEQAAGLNPDGTGTKNAGLFVKRTVDELTNGGYVDELLGIPQFGPLLGSNAWETLEDFQAAIAAGLQPDAARFEYEKFTGQDDIKKAGILVSRASFTNLSLANNNPLFLMPHTGYDNAGSTAPTAGPFVIKDRTDAATPIPARMSAPSVWDAGVPPKMETTAKESFTFLDDVYLWREVNYSNPVPDDSHGTRLQKYSFDDSNGWLTVGGVRDESGACALTLSCDFGQLFPNVWHRPGFPTIAVSRPYFGKSSALLTDGFEVFGPDGTTPAVFDAGTMTSSLSIEPMSGATLKSELFNQVNYLGLSSVFFDTSANGLYANVFSGSMPPVWPSVIAIGHTGYETEATSEQKLAAFIFIAVYSIMLFNHAFGLLLIVASVLAVLRARKLAGHVRVQTSPSKQPEKGLKGVAVPGLEA